MIEIVTGKRVTEEEIREAIQRALGDSNVDFENIGIGSLRVLVEVLEQYGVRAKYEKRGMLGALSRGPDEFPMIIVFRPGHAILLLEIERYPQRFINLTPHGGNS